RTLGQSARLIELAQEINTRMPAYVVERAGDVLNRHGKPLKGATVLLVGVTYKADIADQRETPAEPIVRRLRAKAVDVVYHDPYVPDFVIDGRPVRRTDDVLAAAAEADLTILLQDHKSYDLDEIAAASTLTLDTRGRTHGGAELL